MHIVNELQDKLPISQIIRSKFIISVKWKLM